MPRDRVKGVTANHGAGGMTAGVAVHVTGVRGRMTAVTGAGVIVVTVETVGGATGRLDPRL